MSLPEFTMRQLLEAGVHFGHQTHRWNPKMKSYIFGTRNGIHIVDLAQTVPLLHHALVAIRDTVAQGGRVLFVGTKRAAQDAIADAGRAVALYCDLMSRACIEGLSLAQAGAGKDIGEAEAPASEQLPEEANA